MSETQITWAQVQAKLEEAAELVRKWHLQNDRDRGRDRARWKP